MDGGINMSDQDYGPYDLAEKLKMDVTTDFREPDNLKKYIQHGLAKIIQSAREGDTHLLESYAIELDTFAAAIDDYKINDDRGSLKRTIVTDDVFFCPSCNEAWWYEKNGALGGAEIPGALYDEYKNSSPHSPCPRCRVKQHEHEMDELRKECRTRESIKREKTALMTELMDVINTYDVGPNQRIGYVDVIGILELLKQKYYTKFNRGV